MRIRDIGRAVDGPENTKSTAWQNGQPGVFAGRLQAAGRQCHRDRRTDEGGAAPVCRPRSRPAIKVDILIDRTQTIRASVNDVEFTLMLTIGLVVVVIFLFLRNLWATVIPGITVPLALMAPPA